jgi:hypothetical protein
VYSEAAASTPVPAADPGSDLLAVEVADDDLAERG